MQRTSLLLIALLTTGCLSTRPETRTTIPDEQNLVYAARVAWAQHRPALRCAVLDRVDVVPLEPADVTAECARPEGASIAACVYSVNRTVASPLSTLIYIDRTVSTDRYERLIIHEALHQLRGCWWAESNRDVEVLRHGATEECTITYPGDLGHCDSELWNVIERAAQDIREP